LGDWTPYVTYARYWNDSPTQYTQGSPGVNGISTALRRANLMDQATMTLGTRYEWTPGVALKAQWDHIRTSTSNGEAGTGVGLFNRGDASAQFSNRSNTVNLVTFSLDFIF
jgi:hypothetical protein